MVAFEEEQAHRKTAAPTKSKSKVEENKRSYCVKICICKGRRGLPKGRKENDGPQKEEDSSSIPHPLLPPPFKLDFPVPDIFKWDFQPEATHFSADERGQDLTKQKDRNGMPKTREAASQTNTCHRQHQGSDPIEALVKPSPNYCSVGTQSCTTLQITSDSYCQTINKEVKHCGLQTSIYESKTRESQTDSDQQHCDAVGISHDRRPCRKLCCIKEKVQERDVQRKHPTPNCCKLSRQTCKNKGCDNSNCCRKNPVSCERKQTEFPFVGRTPSGNFKVSPEMVSFENHEFGILVSNPKSVRARVKKVPNFDFEIPSFPVHKLEEEECGQETAAVAVDRRIPCCVMGFSGRGKQLPDTESIINGIQTTYTWKRDTN